MATQTMEKAKTETPQVWNPWSELADMRRQMDAMFSKFFSHGPNRMSAANLYTQNGNLVFEAALPGFEKKDVDIQCTEQTITVKAEHKSEKRDEDKDKGYFTYEMSEGSFHRSMRLPHAVDPAKAKAEMTNGMLKITMPMREPSKADAVNLKIS